MSLTQRLATAGPAMFVPYRSAWGDLLGVGCSPSRDGQVMDARDATSKRQLYTIRMSARVPSAPRFT